jgi:hypothetical protein
MHIAFLTLFLGLVAGRVPVGLAVTGPPPAGTAITAVELLLDGAPAGRIEGPPFQGMIDFGRELLPHHLVARALDAKGAELDRAEQWVNLPWPPAEIEVLPEPGADGRVAAVRLVLHSLTQERPSALTATFDGRPLPLAGERAALPPYSADATHLFTVEARYPSGLEARHDLTLGLSGEVSTDLTGVPVRLKKRARLPAPAALRGWFTEGGQPLAVNAVEEGPAELLVVRAPRVPAALEEAGRKGLRASVHRDFRGQIDSHEQPQLDLLAHQMELGREDRIRFIHPAAQRFSSDGKLASDLFSSSQELTVRDGGLYWLLARVEERGGSARLADAVAVAGIQALTANHPRAVLLVLDGETADRSLYAPAAVRRYLAAIRVPLYVWSARKPADPATHVTDIAQTGWGEVEDVSALSDLRRAIGRLKDDLAAQRIVWLDGRHLPQGIALSPEAERTLELAAGPGR